MNESSGTKLEPKIAGLLCYVLGWITGLIFFLIEEKDEFVRFHAVQSMIVFGAWTIIEIVVASILYAISHSGGGIFSSIWSVFGVVLWIVLMIKAYQGKRFKLPVSGDLAEKYSKGKQS
jgi:uncharacterized membrane protein